MIRLLLSLLLFLSAAASLYANDAQKRPIDDLGYYENMGALVFVYASALFDSEEVAEERVKIAREVSYVMFTYWVQTRIGGLKSSRKVDVAIQKTYKQRFSGAVARQVTGAFQDPVGWAESETPVMGLPKAMRGMSRSEYKALLPKYRTFLDGSAAEGAREGESHQKTKAKNSDL